MRVVYAECMNIHSLIAFDKIVTFWLQSIRSLPCACAYVALFARRLAYNHYTIAYTYNAANTHAQGSDRARWSQKVTLSSKTIRVYSLECDGCFRNTCFCFQHLDDTEKRNRCFWNIHHTQVSSILFGWENMKYIYWYLSTDPAKPIQPKLMALFSFNILITEK